MDLSQSVAAIVAAVLTLIPQPAEAKSDWLHTGQMPTDSEVIQRAQAEQATTRTAEALQEAPAQQPEQAAAVAPPETPLLSPSISQPGNDVWYRLATCESENGRTSPNQFQFIGSTWRSLGMSGSPGNAPYSVQLEAAKRLQARNGWGQWPACSRRLGLR